MKIVNCLNIIGLTLDIIGVILLFFYGISNSIKEGGSIGLILEQSDKGEAKKWNRNNIISKVAILLILIGFIFQLLSNFPL